MKFVLKALWLLLGLVSVSFAYLVPQTLTHLFPTQAHTSVFIQELGITQDEYRLLAERHSVEAQQICTITDYSPVTGSQRTIIAEVLGGEPGGYVHPPFDSHLTRASIMFQGAIPQDYALGHWVISGQDKDVSSFISDFRELWPHTVVTIETLTPRYLLGKAWSTNIGTALLLSTGMLIPIIILSSLTQLPAYQAARLAGASHGRIARTILVTNLREFILWIGIPLGLLALFVAYDIHESSFLAAHDMTLLLIAIASSIIFVAMLTGSLIGWTWTAILTHRRAGTSLGRLHISAAVYVVALAMTWSMCSMSSQAMETVGLIRFEREHAEVQRSLPQGMTLSVWGLTEPTFSKMEPGLSGFIRDMQAEGHLAVTWTLASHDDPTDPMAYSSVTTYLNNTAASYYGIPPVTEGQIAVYPGTREGRDNTTITNDLLEEANYRDSAIKIAQVSVHNEASVKEKLPPDLARASYFAAPIPLDSQDSTIAVVPDNFFSTNDYLSAFSQGTAIIMGSYENLATIRSATAAHQVDGLFGRIDAVGEGSDARVAELSSALLLYLALVITSMIAALGATTLAARSFALQWSGRRTAGQLLGRSPTHAVQRVTLAIPFLAIIAWHILMFPVMHYVMPLGCFALLLAATFALASRPGRSSRDSSRVLARRKGSQP